MKFLKDKSFVEVEKEEGGLILHCNWHLLLLSARKKEKNDKRIVNEESSAFQKEEIPGWAKLVLLVLLILERNQSFRNHCSGNTEAWLKAELYFTGLKTPFTRKTSLRNN